MSLIEVMYCGLLIVVIVVGGVIEFFSDCV